MFLLMPYLDVKMTAIESLCTTVKTLFNSLWLKPITMLIEFR
jgi:hypothetical protein